MKTDPDVVADVLPHKTSSCKVHWDGFICPLYSVTGISVIIVVKHMEVLLRQLVAENPTITRPSIKECSHLLRWVAYIDVGCIEHISDMLLFQIYLRQILLDALQLSLLLTLFFALLQVLGFKNTSFRRSGIFELVLDCRLTNYLTFMVPPL